MKITHLMFSSLFVSLISACAQYAPQSGVPMTFEEMDSNANGYISTAEAQGDVAGKFKSIDSNGDGKINISEYQAYMGKGRMTPPEEMEVPEPGAAPY